MNETKSNRYLIKSLEDFYKIPADKIEDCLKDFAVWLEFGRALDMFQDLIGVKCMEREGFIWIDDGNSGLSEINITVRTKE